MRGADWRPPRIAAVCFLRITRLGLLVRIGAQRPEVGVIVGDADHGEWACSVLAIERRGLGHVKRAAVLVGIVGIVKPETDVECVRRR